MISSSFLISGVGDLVTIIRIMNTEVLSDFCPPSSKEWKASDWEWLHFTTEALWDHLNREWNKTQPISKDAFNVLQEA